MCQCVCVCVCVCVCESVPSNGTVSRKGGGGNLTSVLPCIHGQATKSGCVLLCGCFVRESLWNIVPCWQVVILSDGSSAT